MNRDKIIYISTAVVSVLIIIGVIAFIVSLKSESVKNVEFVSESLDTSVSSTENSENISVETETQNISEQEYQQIEEDKQSEEVEEIKEAENTKKENKQPVLEETSKTEEPLPDPTFIMPVEGEIFRNYAKDQLVYSDTLKEWITHLGIDIKAEKTTIVKASSDGKIIAIKNDPRYGLSIMIEHNNGYSTMYSNLLTAEFVKVGEIVKQGDTIGTVGNTAVFEILDEPHLHFEILKDGVQVDPNMYL